MPPAQHDQAQAPAGAGALPSSFRRTGWDSTPPASSALQHDETQATATPNHAPARGSPVSTPDAWQQHQAPMPRAPSDHDQAPATPAGSVPRFRRTGWDYTPPASTSHPPSSVGDDVHSDIPPRPSALQQHQTQATATPNHVLICGPPVSTPTNPGNRSEFSDVTPATLSSRNGPLQEDIRGLYESYSSQTHEASKHHAELFASKTLEASKHHAELFASTYSETLNMLVNEKNERQPQFYLPPTTALPSVRPQDASAQAGTGDVDDAPASFNPKHEVMERKMAAKNEGERCFYFDPEGTPSIRVPVMARRIISDVAQFAP